MPIYDRFEGGISTEWTQETAPFTTPTLDYNGWLTNGLSSVASCQLNYEGDGTLGDNYWIEAEIAQDLIPDQIPSTGFVDNGYYMSLSFHSNLTNQQRHSLLILVYPASYYAGKYEFAWYTTDYGTTGTGNNVTNYGYPLCDDIFQAGPSVTPAGARVRYEKNGSTYTASVYSPVTKEYTILGTGTTLVPSGGYPSFEFFTYEYPSQYSPRNEENGLPAIGMVSMGENKMPLNAQYPRDACPSVANDYHEAFISLMDQPRAGDLQTDYRNALAASLGITEPSEYSIDDLFKLAYEREYQISI